MRTPLFVPLVLFSTLSFALAVVVLACAAHSLHSFNDDQGNDEWLLPIWRAHFDTRDLQGFIGAGAYIALTSLVLLLTTTLAKASLVIDLLAACTGAVAALIALILSNVLARRAPVTDTLQTWTCSWVADSTAVDQGLSPNFSTICGTTRTAFYGIIPLFVLQLILITCVVMAPFLMRKRTYAYGGAIEKGQQLDAYDRNGSWDASRNSPKSVPSETVRPMQ